MSDPTRYAFKMDEDNDAIYLGPKEQADGQFVLYSDYIRLKADLEKSDSAVWTLSVENARLKAEVERLTKAVMHSPAAQLKLKELEGKTTFDEINPKGGQP